ncbi:MAG: hypothetical protein MUF06_14950 [Pirellulaceae bacterium]|nr:hypothetical protein [Pirellulaceae bacterium]
MHGELLQAFALMRQENLVNFFLALGGDFLASLTDFLEARLPLLLRQITELGKVDSLKLGLHLLAQTLLDVAELAHLLVHDFEFAPHRFVLQQTKRPTASESSTAKSTTPAAPSRLRQRGTGDQR